MLATRVIDPCSEARTVVAYNAPFERTAIEGLATAVPHLTGSLQALVGRMRDLLPIVRDHVYHPGFGGSFSLKPVVASLIPELAYDDLEVADGGAASAALEALLFERPRMAEPEVNRLRASLLRYCERDTQAMATLVGLLRVRATTRRSRESR